MRTHGHAVRTCAKTRDASGGISSHHPVAPGLSSAGCDPRPRHAVGLVRRSARVSSNAERDDREEDLVRDGENAPVAVGAGPNEVTGQHVLSGCELAEVSVDLAMRAGRVAYNLAQAG